MTDLRLEHLTLYNFKNYEEASLHFSARFVVLAGNNGAGKTNVLDAIHYLSSSKSYFNPIDSQNISLGQEQCAITGDFAKGDQLEQIVCSIRKNQRKVMKRNYKEYDKLADHIGLFPVVMITPYDIELIWEGSEVRRKFLDTTLSQLSRPYLDRLMAYNHALLQRNNLLKSFARGGNYSRELLEPWDFQLEEHASFVHEQRNSFLAEFIPCFCEVYTAICGVSESMNIVYESDLHDKSMAELIDQNANRDKILERTSAGVHRDDLLFVVDQRPIKKFASQGQQKAFLFALKLAQYKFLSTHMKINPILMLDDLFDKIDELRIAGILNWLVEQDTGQVFITDTHMQRVPDILRQRQIEFQVMHVSAGAVSMVG
jgi:DNA replication and repair protein RecF